MLSALAAEGYTTPTPIQDQAIPLALAGRDVCGIAQTGTGKTAAFALPILERLRLSHRGAISGACRALVLSPTRELASQIADSFRAYGKSLPLSTAVVFGGVAIGQQRRQLARGVDILVATPGRLLDLIDSGSLSLSRVEILVLDEADRMLDLGFVHALRRIVKLLPQQRQTLLFSATMPKSIATLADQYLTDPVRVAVTPAATTVDLIEQSVVFVDPDRKRDLLAKMLRDPAYGRVLVFTRTKHGADRVARHLDNSGVAVAAIHGNKSQPQRERALAAFRAGEARVLVATDIAARGIDVDGVSHVVNFELPNVPEDYVHRIGRTARAGAAGIAVAFCSNEERPYLRDIEKLTRRSIPMMPALAIDLKPGPMPRQEDRPAAPARSAPARSAPARSAPARSAPVRVGGPDRDDLRAAQIASLPGFLRGGKEGGGRDRKTGPTTSFRGRRTKRSSMSHRPTAVL
ncbi:MAG TPA: DEAD/DEAH box helicase [Stellaceae bacterium]|nr:DEAD/DEAH box helicase [Stellaceae bacterium]